MLPPINLLGCRRVRIFGCRASKYKRAFKESFPVPDISTYRHVTNGHKKKMDDIERPDLFVKENINFDTLFSFES